MNLPLGLLALIFALVQGKKQPSSERFSWNYRDGADKVNINGVQSVTRLLDHWGNRIFKQMKDTMINKPQDVLPDYSRVQPLSEALDDLFNEVKALKKRLADLSESLVGLENVFTQVGYGKPVKVKRVVKKKMPRKVSVYQTPNRTIIRTTIRTPNHRSRAVGRRESIIRRFRKN